MDTRRIVRSAGFAAVAWAVASAFAAEPSLGTFTDARDGQAYKTVKIGRQTWMARNLNYQPKTGTSWCYENSADSCKKYGRLYDWKTATAACPQGWRLPSMDDWNELVGVVGTKTTDVFTDSGKKLKSKTGWNKNGNGTDDFGFSALPGGYRHSDNDRVECYDSSNCLNIDRAAEWGIECYDSDNCFLLLRGFDGVGVSGAWWTAADMGGGGIAYCRNMYSNYAKHDYVAETFKNKGAGMSVRCVAEAK